jgi:hypothetical protein
MLTVMLPTIEIRRNLLNDIFILVYTMGVMTRNTVHPATSVQAKPNVLQ